jgi:hypothetical protein
MSARRQSVETAISTRLSRPEAWRSTGSTRVALSFKTLETTPFGDRLDDASKLKVLVCRSPVSRRTTDPSSLRSGAPWAYLRFVLILASANLEYVPHQKKTFGR